MQKLILAIETDECLAQMVQYLHRFSLPENVVTRVIHAIEPLEIAFEWPNEQYRIATDEMLANFIKNLKIEFPNMLISGAVIIGDAREVILAEAEALPADTVILGAHGKNKFVRFPLGRVSSAIAERAKCSVVIYGLNKNKILC